MNEVDRYIDSFPDEIKTILARIRALIKKHAAEAEESIAYKMPAYRVKGKPLIYFAGFKNHIGLYATPSGHSEFEKELSVYKHGKGSVQFPLSQPIPYDLIERIVIFRLHEVDKPDKKQTPASTDKLRNNL
ncbi:MAG: DUF1801 domain-containing protein [Bacteroidales bacterium]|nr:DUF1801 domain-containing protein [Bacteroidales bacterium]